MAGSDKIEVEQLLNQIKRKVAVLEIRVTQHAQQEMVDEEIEFDEVVQAIENGEILENYPEHRRGACCLINGLSKRNRPLHIVCTTGDERIVVVTVYEPMPPKWLNPTQRRPK